MAAFHRILSILFLLIAGNEAEFLSETRKSVLIVIGTRPDVIKLSSTILAIRGEFDPFINLTVVSSGQHRELLEPMLQSFNIHPDISLDLMEFSKSGSANFVAKGIEQFSALFRGLVPKPDAVVVQGDTNTALAGAMAAFYNQIPVVHIEAGLRTWDLSAPYPEEFNRRTISLIAEVSFAPTEASKTNLIKDGSSPLSIKITGNTVIDAVKAILEKQIEPHEKLFIDTIDTYLMQNSKRRKYLIFSSHRQENFGSSLEHIIESVLELSSIYKDFVFLFILHMNPNSRGPVKRSLDNIENVRLVEPVDYGSFLRLLKYSSLIITDSGGMQEESSYLGIPCIVLRDLTERPEGIEYGVAQLVALNKIDIVDAVSKQLFTIRTSGNIATRAESRFIYGDGLAGKRIACFISQYFNKSLDENANCQDSKFGEFVFNNQKPLLAREIDLNDENTYSNAVETLANFPLDVHPNALFRPFYHPGRISVIITQYKRNTTEIQLRAVFGQTVFSKIDRILIVKNDNYVDLNFLKNIDFSDEIIDSETSSKQYEKSRKGMNKIIQIVSSENWNTKYYGRFALALLFDSEFTVVLDDDTIPQPRWLEISTALSSDLNAIVGPVGVVVGPEKQYYFNPPLNFFMEVDYTGHSWVFKTEWLKYLWGSHIPSWEAGEDIAFSALAWLNAGIRTVMPSMPLNAYELWGDSVTRFHKDGNETHTLPLHRLVRWPLTRYWISRGWVPTPLRNIIVGPKTLCHGKYLNCQPFFDHILPEFVELEKSMMNMSKSSKRGLLARYIKQPTNALTIWFEEKERPTTVDEENELKRLSSFPYKEQSLKQNIGINSDNGEKSSVKRKKNKLSSEKPSNAKKTNSKKSRRGSSEL